MALRLLLHNENPLMMTSVKHKVKRYVAVFGQAFDNTEGFMYKTKLTNSRLYHVSGYLRQATKDSNKITTSKAKTEVSFAKKVTEAGKDVTYTGVVVVGLAVTGFIFYMIGRELMSGDSPNVIFGQALKKCKNNEEVDEALGGSIKGRGEMTRRGRARHVSHMEYEKDGVKHMRMKFYLIGAIRQGTAHLEVKQNESGKYETRYLFVEVDTYPQKTIIIQDNR